MVGPNRRDSAVWHFDCNVKGRGPTVSAQQACRSAVLSTAQCDKGGSSDTFDLTTDSCIAKEDAHYMVRDLQGALAQIN